jgi:hypothetical protein
MKEAEKIEKALAEDEESKKRPIGSNFDSSVIKEAIESAEVFFQVFKEETKRAKGKKADS